MDSLIVAGIAVRTDAEGRYFLNDLHKAAGNERWYEPANWRITNSFKGLVAELETTGIPVVSIPGRNGGTYVVKELVYANAMWISPRFHLKVIRAYDALVTGNQLPSIATLDSLPPADIGPALKCSARVCAGFTPFRPSTPSSQRVSSKRFCFVGWDVGYKRKTP